MAENLALSVVIPVYNLEKYIVPCIESVIANKGVDKDSFEVIVVNDGSTDGSQKNVERYMEQHQGYHIYLINQKNQGVSAARNAGLAKARGEFVWFIDGDDAISSDSLSHIQVLINDSIDVLRIADCVGNVLYEDNEMITSYNSLAQDDEGYLLPAYKLLGHDYGHGHTTYIWRRDFLVQYGLEYPIGISHNEDFYFLVSSLLLAGQAYVNLSLRFYLYREGICSVSRGQFDSLRLDKYVQSQFSVLNKLLWLDIPESQDKYIYYRDYLNRYIYVIIADCFFRKYPFFLIIYVLQRLKAMRLYPMNFSLIGISKFRIWLFNQSSLFMLACLIYRVVFKNKDIND